MFHVTWEVFCINVKGIDQEVDKDNLSNSSRGKSIFNLALEKQFPLLCCTPVYSTKCPEPTFQALPEEDITRLTQAAGRSCGSKLHRVISSMEHLMDFCLHFR